MKKKAPSPPKASINSLPEIPGRSPFAPVSIAIGAVLIGLSLLGAMVFFAPRLAAWGLVGQFWYVLLVAVALCAATFLFALRKSQALYKGTVFNGQLELRGPVVVFFAVILLGFKLAPAPTLPLDVTVLLQPAPNDTHLSLKQIARQGTLTLDIGADRRTESIGDKGEARFIGLANHLRGQQVTPHLDSALLELVEANTPVVLGDEPVRLTVRVKQTRFVGQVYGTNHQPLAQARIRVDNQTTSTDADGRFELFVRADLPVAESFVDISAPGYRPYRVAVTPGGNPLQAQLQRS